MNARRSRLGAVGVVLVCVAVLGTLLPAQVSYGQAGIWPKFRQNVQNTGQSPFSGPDAPAVAWQFDTGSNVVSSAAIGPDGASYVGAFNGTLHALNPDGTPRWQFDIGANSILSSPALDDQGFVYFGADNNTFYALDPAGALAWTFDADGPVRSSPAVLDGIAYFGTENGSVYAVIDEGGGVGEVVWQFIPTIPAGSFFSSPALLNIQQDLRLYIGAANGVLYALNAFGGGELWSFQTGDAIESSPAVDGNGTVYVGSDDGFLYAVNDGQLQWQAQLGGAVRSSPALSGGRVYVGADDGNLYAVNSATGAILWNFPTGGFVFSSPAVGEDGTIYVGSDDGTLYAVAPGGQLLWQITLGQTIAASPSISSDPTGKNASRAGANTLVVSTLEGTTFAIGPAPPQLIIESIDPVATPTVAVGESVVYTITVVDQGGVPVPGAIVEVDDGLQGDTFTTVETDANGQTTYETAVLDGTAEGVYDLAFIARAGGFADSEALNRRVEVVNQPPPRLAISSLTPSGIPELGIGESLVYTITVVDQGTGEPVPGAVVDVDDGLRGAIFTTVETDANGQTTYQAVVPQDTPVGRYSLSFVARAEGFDDSDPVVRRLDVVIRQPGLVVEPVALDFGLTPLGDTGSSPVTIRNSGDQVLNVRVVRITGAQADDFSLPALNLPFNVAPGESTSFSLGFMPGRRGRRAAVLEVDSDGGMVNVPLAGEGAAPGIGVAPALLIYGAVDVGTMADNTLTLTNIGNATLTLSSLDIAGPDASAFAFVSGEGARTLAPGGAHEVVVRFTPQRADAHVARIEISNDATDDEGTPVGVVTVPLRGEGTIVPMPALSVTPDTLQFGEIALGTTSGELIGMIENTGNVDLDVLVQVLGANPDSYTIIRDDASGIMTPTDPPREVVVRFTPERLGRILARLEILWNGNQTRLWLRGTGVAARLEEPQTDPARDGAPVGIRVTVPQGFTPTTRQLFFRLGGETAYRQVDLQDDQGGLLGMIPPQFVTERGLEYYVSLTDDALTVTFPAVNPANNPVVLPVAVDLIQVGGVFQPEVYRMVSAPLELADATVQQLVDDFGPPDPAQWRVLRWRPADAVYEEAPTPGGGGPRFGPGLSTWLITRTGQDFDVVGGVSVDTSEPYRLVLQPGWTQIANPFAFPVEIASIGGLDALQGPYFYDGTEYQLDQNVLVPWEGYFVMNPGTTPATLLVPPVESGILSKQNGPGDLFPEADFMVQLRAALPGHRWRDTQNFVGFAEAAAAHPAAFTLPEPPPIGDHLRLSILHDGRRYVSHFTPTGEGGRQWDLEIEAVLHRESRFAPKTVRVALAEHGQRPERYDLYVFDRDLGRVLPITDAAFDVVLTTEHPVRHLSIVVGTAAFAEAHSEGASLTPTDYVLEANYPNPFNPETVIRYGLHQQSAVDLAIYNVLGQRVRTLVAAEQNSGRYDVVWDGLDDAGRAVASGVYVYQLRAGGFLTSRTMLLLR